MVRLFAILAGLASLAHAYDCVGDDASYYKECAHGHCETYGEDLCANGYCVDIDTDPNFRCECDEEHKNLTPQHCVKKDEKVDPCKISTCDETALCYQVSYETAICMCPDGLQVPPGMDCEKKDEKVDPCISTCDETAECYEDFDDTAICMCPDGIEVPPGMVCPASPPVASATCDSNPCGENAKCIVTSDGVVCLCPNSDDQLEPVAHGTPCPSHNTGSVICKSGSCGRGQDCSVEDSFIVCKCGDKEVDPSESCF
jgi:hypothetical protein